MPDESTWKEEATPEEPGSLVLVRALTYDDLLSPGTRAHRLDQIGAIELGRGKGIETPGGRLAPGGRIEVDDRRASTRHLRLELRAADRLGPVVLAEDLGSKNGSFVNGAALTKKTRLVDGDTLEVGHVLFVVRTASRRLADLMPSDGDGVALGPTRTWCPELSALAVDLTRIGPSSEPVLVLGETGAGKEVIAQALHDLSGRRGPLVSLDCGAIPESLFEATLFGHKKGAFTGAGESRVGEITRAHTGTLFLDEIANMSLASQAKLLRVLEVGRVTPLGDSESRTVDVRYVAATNSAILLESSGFRRDLLARLAGFVGTLPPLRKRREDLGELTAHILREANAGPTSITVAAGRRLFGAKLEGNIRELRAILRSAVLLARGAPIDGPHLGPLPTEAPREVAAEVATRAPIDLETVTAALTASKGNVVRTATALGVHPRQLYRYLERFGLDVERFRSE